MIRDIWAHAGVACVTCEAYVDGRPSLVGYVCVPKGVSTALVERMALVAWCAYGLPETTGDGRVWARVSGCEPGRVTAAVEAVAEQVAALAARAGEAA